MRNENLICNKLNKNFMSEKSYLLKFYKDNDKKKNENTSWWIKITLHHQALFDHPSVYKFYRHTLPCIVQYMHFSEFIEYRILD